MPYSIENRLRVDVQFNGVSFDFGVGNTLNFIHMSESTRLGIPMLHLSVTDITQWFKANQVLADGAVITIDVTVGPQSTGLNSVRQFRYNCHHETTSSLGRVYQIDAYLNYPTYWSGSTSTPIDGTSDDVLQNICDATGLELDSVGANDTQVWQPRNLAYYKFAREVAAHGYLSDSSCMSMAVTLDGLLCYVDISQMEEPQATAGIYDVTTPGIVPVVGYKPFVASGAFNQMSGYDQQRIEQDPTVTDPSRIFSAVAFNPNEGGSLLVNNSVRSGIGQGHVQFAPIEVGNNHDEYQRAYYQNKRVSNLFTAGLYLLTPTMSPVSVLDCVNVTVPNESGSLQAQELAEHSGVYRVTSKTIFIQGGNYVEKLELVRRTVKAQIPDATTGKGSTSALSQAINFDVSSLADYSALDPTSLATSIDGSFAPTLSSYMTSSTSQLGGMAAGAAGPVVGSGSTLTTLVNAELSAITSLETTALAAILVERNTIFAAGDLGMGYGGGLAPCTASLDAVANPYMASINSSVASAMPGIVKQVGRSVNIGAVQGDLVASLGTMTTQITDGLSAASDAIQKVLESMAATSIPSLAATNASFQSASSTATAGVASTASTASSTITSAVATAVASPGTVTTQQAASIASIHAAVAAALTYLGY